MRAVIAVLLLAPALAQAQTPSQPPTFRSEVIETTPLPGMDLPLDAIPSPVQTALSSDLLNTGALDVSAFLNRRLTNVFINEIQGNPFQADVSYRGYTASPLLGTPQGLSVYMDGVRLNQPFGDVVSWDLIPRAAIASTTLMPGSNPLFGLNTLGGALSLQTKDGRAAPGTTARVTGGAYGRRAIEVEHGGARANGLDWYLSGNLFHETGWRAASPSDIRQIFAKSGWRDVRSAVQITAAYADNRLNGNALQEQRLLEADYASVYTIPDITTNRAAFVNVSGRRSLAPQVSLTANGYFRRIRTGTLNGDINEDSLDQNVYSAGENAVNTPFPSSRCRQQIAARDEPGEKCNGLLNRTSTSQNNYGLSAQLNAQSSAGGVSSRFTIGGGFDRSTLGFTQSTELGYLSPDRSITGLGVFADGVSAGTIDGEPLDNRVDLEGTVRTASAFATDTITVHGVWNVTISGRFNQTVVSNRDRITPLAGHGSLTGDYTFNRFNPAAGLTVSPAPGLNLYAGYSEGSRAPTSIELGCADPAAPCRLPNALVGDPPLDLVVTRTWEAGARGGRGRAGWNAGVFRGTNVNDLLFVASTQTGFGYFKNFGETRRQGVELGVNVRAGRVTSGAGYAFTSATYQSEETVAGANNSSNVRGTIAIRPGDRIPLIPAHTLKAYAAYSATPKLSIDLDLVSASGSPARGNENSAHQPDGRLFLGEGSSPAYAIVNAGARYAVTRRLELIGQVDNIFNTPYYSGAQLGPTGITPAGTFVARPLPASGGVFPLVRSTFYAPGAPISGWLGARVKF